MTELARAAVVIPAHDEAAVIGACLAPLRDLVAGGQIEVVVAANGCTDTTAQVAAAVNGIWVTGAATASKVVALNAGDRVIPRAARIPGPRLYLDADVVVPAEAVLALATALSTPRPVAGSVAVRFITDGRPWLVRAFYRAYARTPYVTDQLVGLGLYGLSAAGRTRFEQFPDLTADDLFVQRLFAPHERVVLAEHSFDVQTPRTLAALIAVRMRSALGAGQLAAAGGGARTTTSTVMTLMRLAVREPCTAPDVAVYLAINAIARWRAGRRGAAVWHRDTTTR